MKVLAILGSPRLNGNTHQMLETALRAFPENTEIHRINLAELNISACGSCRECNKTGECAIIDDMQKIYEELTWAEIIILGSPSLFGDVSVDIKKFMERTWCIKGGLKNKIGAYVVSGRRYIESTLNTIHAFMLRHRMILGGSGAIGYTFSEMGGLENDPLALSDSYRTGIRTVEIYNLIHNK